MAKNAEFRIVINGIQESINAVDSLNKQLDALEKRINDLSKRNINVSTSGGSNKAALDEEAKMLQQIEQLHQRVAASEKAEYQELLHAKEELKEYQQIAKSIAAQTNLDQGINDTSTMMGMKAQLKDIKTAMQTLDVESDKFKQLQQDANELNAKLKEIEQGYGQFGRNVGNYAEGVADGMQKIVIKVGDTEREFNNAREASRTLNMELKSMALNGQQNTQEYQDLNDAVKQMNSTLKDVEVSSVAMDNLLDTMQGIVALASAGQGIASLFGIDDSEIEKSIQKLVALQNVLQGIETIRMQMQTQEGIGMILSRGNKAVDSLVKSIVGVGTASKGATIAVKLLSGALKGIGIGLVVAAVSALISKISDWVEKQKEAKKQAEELAKEENKLNASLQVQRVQMQNTLSTLESFNGSKKEEQAIVKDLNSKYGSALGTYKTIAEWKDALKKKTDAYIESLKLEAQMQAAIKQLEDAYIKQREAQNYDVGFWEGLFEGEAAVRTRVKAAADQAVKAAEDAVTDIAKRINENNRKNQINLFAPADTKATTNKVKDAGRKVEDAVRQAETNINDLRLKLMRDGLAKSLMQLDETNRKEIEKIRKNGQKVEEQLRLQQQVYEQERRKILQEYSNETLEIIDENKTRDIQTQIDKINNSLDNLGRKMNVTFNEPRSSLDNLTKKLKDIGMTIDDYFFVGDVEPNKRAAFNEGHFDEYIQQLVKDDKIQKFLIEKWGDDVIGYSTKTIEEAYEKVYSKVIELRREYGSITEIFGFDENDKPNEIGTTLSASLQNRTEITRGLYKNLLNQEQEFYRKRSEIQKQALDNEEKELTDATENEINELQKTLESLKNKDNISTLTSGAITSDSSLAEIDAYFSKIRDENRDTYTDLETEAISYVNRLNALYDKLESLAMQYSEKRKKIEIDTNKDIAASENKLFDQRFKDYEDYISKINYEMSNLPTTNSFGFTDIKGLKKVTGEITETVSLMRQYIQNDIDLVNDDFRNGIISEEDKNRIIANLSSIFGTLDEVDKATSDKMKGARENLKKEIDFWIQQVGQAATSIIQSIGEINQAAFEKQLEAIERQTDALEDQLDKQKELTQKYADDVNDIEDELENSRGDRRQYLIDQLNAQMQAQRESLAQEKRIEKEQERLAKKREQLEYENEMRKWEQSKLTAAINAALAISNAAVNAYPMPAIPMIALATSIGAAQMAAVLANKPKKYADGGKLEGKSHAQGGIKVLGGQAELEGGEFVTNKHTTTQNLALLQFINNKKRKIDLSDMIDFYSNGTKKNISNVRKTYLAEGGQLPLLRNDINISDRLVTTMEQYNNRPVVVQVVDIINKADNVRKVQTLSGLNPKEL